MSVAVWAKFVDVVGRIIFPPTSQKKKKKIYASLCPWNLWVYKVTGQREIKVVDKLR